jgi:hypothetical protein
MGPEHSSVVDDEDDDNDDGLPFWDLEKTVSSLCHTGLRRYTKCSHIIVMQLKLFRMRLMINLP